MNRRRSPSRKVWFLLLAVGVLLSVTQGHAQTEHCREELRCCSGQGACAQGSDHGAVPGGAAHGEDAQGHCDDTHCSACLGLVSGLTASTRLPSEALAAVPVLPLQCLLVPEIFRPPLSA